MRFQPVIQGEVRLFFCSRVTIFWSTTGPLPFTLRTRSIPMKSCVASRRYSVGASDGSSIAVASSSWLRDQPYDHQLRYRDTDFGNATAASWRARSARDMPSPGQPPLSRSASMFPSMHWRFLPRSTKSDDRADAHRSALGQRGTLATVVVILIWSCASL
jgi:hypothetical protein